MNLPFFVFLSVIVTLWQKKCQSDDVTGMPKRKIIIRF
jgi:hypothetical protein